MEGAEEEEDDDDDDEDKGNTVNNVCKISDENDSETDLMALRICFITSISCTKSLIFRVLYLL